MLSIGLYKGEMFGETSLSREESSIYGQLLFNFPSLHEFFLENLDMLSHISLSMRILPGKSPYAFIYFYAGVPKTWCRGEAHQNIWCYSRQGFNK